ncbi:MAG: PstS family phosphate ABC transporter substrate-binding protein [Gemmatimonadota bacterium]
MVRWTIEAALAVAVLAACGGGEAGERGGVSGAVAIDGSSTVYPITEAVAEELQRANAAVRVTVGISGTGGGFKKFCAGETDVSDASRPIRAPEREACAANGIEPLEIPVAWDGLTVVANGSNDWAECLTVDELKRIWQPGSTIRHWSEVRPEWPDREIELYGPDTDSGTFDYFTEAIVGEEDASRSDYTASADDNVLVIGVEGDEGALGYFGYAYYEENRDRLKAVAVDDGSGCVAPSRETVQSGAYRPLSRPLFLYVSREALERPEVRAFVEFYLQNAAELVPQVGYVPLATERYAESLAGLFGSTGAGG